MKKYKLSDIGNDDYNGDWCKWDDVKELIEIPVLIQQNAARECIKIIGNQYQWLQNAISRRYGL